MFRFLKKLFDTNRREIEQLKPLIEQINLREKKTIKLKEKDFAGKTAEFKQRLSGGETLDNILPEAFALAREAAKRTIGERHFDVQLMAGIVLHQGKIAEQKTGEGKTLSAVLPLYLNALTGRGVHLVTVNDYLARRDCGWMGPVYYLLGLSCSAIIAEASFIYDPNFVDKNAKDWRLQHLRPISRKEAYRADITYGINSEFGFDYLRDNMTTELSQAVQRGYHYAIVDEVDSVLIDEARTPHIISAPDTEPTEKYYQYAKTIEKLNPEIDYEIDEKLRTAHFTEHGISKIEKMFGIKDIYEQDFTTLHHLEAALKARTLFHRDKDYIVKDNQIIIVDEFTGRLMHGRRWSEGIHQAVEAKEGVSIQRESRTLATVSLQNYFRMYEKLAGMTGTAATEAEEFNKIYKLKVVIILTNKPMIRKDNPDMVYKTIRAKYAAVAKEIEDCYKKGQPVLVGTTSIENNEILGDFLRKKGIPHNLLNAKNHENEAMIITRAGEKKAVTVATNMAGRGVDIILGGTPPNKYVMGEIKVYRELLEKWRKAHQEVVKLGGLHVIGTERHESRRIDNQLRGRSGRQGDPGSSRFYVSLEDEIMRIFGGEQIARLMTTFKMPEDIPLEHPMVSRAIEQSQIKVEGFNFDIRKRLVEYDDVINKQREIIYGLRKKILEQEGKKEGIKKMILEKLKEQIENLVHIYAPEGIIEKERERIVSEFISIIPFNENSQAKLKEELVRLSPEKISPFLFSILEKAYEQREKELGEDLTRQVEKWVTLGVIDNLWMNHLDAIDDLREGIGLRGYAQRDPLVEYKNEAFVMFERLMKEIDYQITHRIFKVQVQFPPQQLDEIKKQEEGRRKQAQVAGQSESTVFKSTPVAGQQKKKIGRNDPCWCGSGKKWKKCHMYNDLGR